MQDENAEDGPSLVSVRTMEIVVALLLMAGAAVVIYDSVKHGYGWIENEGPAPGYFPFYVAAILGVLSLITLMQAVLRGSPASFVSRPAFGRVAAILLPTVVYVALIGGISIGPVDVPGLGIYVASAIFITIFMIVFGHENFFKSGAVGIGVALALFFLFERWFLVPLPKGPLEAMLGLG